VWSTTRSSNAASSISSATSPVGYPDALASTVAKRMRAAYRNPNSLVAQAELEALARELDRSHPGATGSLHAGLTETLTIGRLGVSPTLARTLRSTNTIESMIEICRDHAANARALAGRADGAALDRRWHGRGRPSSSAGSTATCICPRCGPRSTRRLPPMSHRPRRMPPDHPRTAAKFHGERDN
jgi:hypothetical protein